MKTTTETDGRSAVTGTTETKTATAKPPPKEPALLNPAWAEFVAGSFGHPPVCLVPKMAQIAILPYLFRTKNRP